MIFNFNDVLLPEWMEEENNARTEKYARDINDEKFLIYLNDLLLQHGNIWEKPAEEPYPIIFFFGIPRCGKTVFSQMLVHALDLGYPDNIIARFWKAPQYGIYLSKILQKSIPRDISFKSDYGKTKNLFEPHDFHYFWQKWLDIKQIMPYDYLAAKKTIDWQGLRKELSSFSHIFRKCCVFKGINQSYHLSIMSKTYKKSLFIYLQRDFIDAAISFRKLRIDNFGDSTKWAGQNPAPEIYEQLIKLPYNEQIAGQFKYLTEMYKEEISKTAPEKVIRIYYEEFCKNPNTVIKQIRDKVKKLYDFNIPIINEIVPNTLKLSKHSENLPFYQELVEGLNKFGLPLRFNL